MNNIDSKSKKSKLASGSKKVFDTSPNSGTNSKTKSEAKSGNNSGAKSKLKPDLNPSLKSSTINNQSENQTIPPKELLKNKVKDFPLQSGVYLMKNQGGKVIYVGKAKILRNRVRSYLIESADLTPKTKLLVKNIFDIEFILTKTEVEAFLLEASLIKKFRPKYNIRLKDDKSYPYIRLSVQDEYPRLYLSRRVKKDGSRYFGPFTNSFSVNETIRFLNRTFKIRDCTDFVMKSRRRPCMTHQIGRCTAPCVDYVTSSEYKKDIQGAQDFLDGKSKNLLQNLKERMLKASEQEQFEVAARFRDSLKSVQNILEKQTVVKKNSLEKDQDIFGYFKDNSDSVVIQGIFIRSGRNIGTRAFVLSEGFSEFSENSENSDTLGNSNHLKVIDKSEAIEKSENSENSVLRSTENSISEHGQRMAEIEGLISFLNQYYDDNLIPDEVLLPLDIGLDLSKLLSDVLKERSNKKIIVRYPSDPEGRALMEQANALAKDEYNKQKSKSESKYLGLDEIKIKLDLTDRPLRIECYDISHFQGTNTVASQVVFEDGIPNPDEYRRYQLKENHNNNDFASMQEVLSRRFKHLEWDLPQLIVIDGGKGQLNAALQIMEQIKKQSLHLSAGMQDALSKIAFVGLAKSRTQSDFTKDDVQQTEERFFLPNRSNPVIFKTNSEAFHILVGIRDEAHRFAITYHRKLRQESSLESELDMIIGLGQKRKKDLLKRFENIEALRVASVEELMRVPGVNRVLAERICLQLNETDSESEFELNSDL